MTGRERLQAIFSRRPADRLSWSTLVDDNTLGALPAPWQGLSALDFYRRLGCDILQLGDWGLPASFGGVRLVQPGVEESWSTDAAGNRLCTSRCAHGTLTGKMAPNWHPLEYFVKTAEDVRLACRRWEESHYEALDVREPFRQAEAAVGDAGVCTLFLGASAIPYLLEYLIGMEQFYYLLADYPEEVDALIRVLQEKDRQRFEIVAATNPCGIGILCENTSTYYISPEIYAKYNMPSQRDFTQAMHRHGKTAILHMCGHVRQILPVIRETGADGIHALTPPPLGDTPWELALDVLGEDMIIQGCLTPDIFLAAPLAEVGPALDRLITPRLRQAHFILGPFADGISVPLERFLAVRDWTEKHG